MVLGAGDKAPVDQVFRGIDGKTRERDEGGGRAVKHVVNADT